MLLPKNNEYVVKKEFLSRLGRLSNKVRKELVDKFPDLYNDENKFCYLGQILVSNKRNSLYTIVKINRELRIYNITNSSAWKTSLPESSIQSCYIKSYTENKIITRGMFRELLGDNTYRFEEFYPIDTELILNLRKK